MNKIKCYISVGTVIVVSSVTRSSTVYAARPNVVLIMLDDLGYGDLGVTGAPDIKTPNVDRIAHSGLIFENYYTAGPTSTPTRCALISGRYQARFQNMEAAFHMGVNHIGLPRNEETVARSLQRSGYSTALFGKWHIGSLPHQQPQNQGFDKFIGLYSGNVDYFVHCEKDRTSDLYQNGKPIKDQRYMTDLIADESVKFIKSEHKKPFFLYVAFNSPHWPYQGPTDDPCVADGSNWMKGSRTKLVNMIEHTDKRIGDISRAIEEMGLDDNTIVIVTSDNGGDQFARNFPFSGGKGTLSEGGIRLPLFVKWKNHIIPNSTFKSNTITMDISASIVAACGAKFKAKQDGLSFFPYKFPLALFEDRPLVWRYGVKNQYAVRLGKYKLLVSKNQKKLYDLAVDPAEKNDMAMQLPQLVDQLQQIYDKWEKEMPYKQQKFDGALRQNNQGDSEYAE